MFPRLTSAQMDRVAVLGKRRKVDRGTMLVNQGDDDVPLFLVVAGEIEIVQPKNATIYVNGKLVQQNKIYVDREQLYTLIEVDGQQEGELELRTTKPGLLMYTFTFGG